jgi:prepilin-type N-terminal cleavage/methylation domain-containing protein
MLNEILLRKIKFPLSWRGAFSFCHSRLSAVPAQAGESGNPSSLSLREALSHVIARKRSDRSNLNLKGFSLIELMVAVVILSMAIFGIFNAFNSGWMGMADSRDRTVATNYAQEAMEDVKNMDFEKIITTTKSVTNASKKYRVDVNVSLEDPNLKKVLTVDTTMLVQYLEVFASDPAKIVLFAESYAILNTPTDDVYATTGITAVIKDINGNTIIDWGERPGEGDIIFSITSTDKFGTFSNALDYIIVEPVNGKADTTFTSNGTMSGNFGINVIEASVYLPVAEKTVTDTTTIKITNGPVKIKLEADPLAIKASTTNYSTITVSLIDATGQTLAKKNIFDDVEISLSVFEEGSLSTPTITIPYITGGTEGDAKASATIILNSTGNPGLASVVATAADLESGKIDVRFLGPPVAISISANPIYVDDEYSTISVNLLDINGFNTSPSDESITISLVFAFNDTGGSFEGESSWEFPVSDSEGIIKETKFSGQSSTGTAIITASGGGLESSVTINVISALEPHHIKLTANPQYVKADGFELSTITAVVYDISGKIVTNYTGTITFETTLGNFSDNNFDNGVATVKLSSITSGTATITVSSSDSLDSVPAEGIEVAFYGAPNHIELIANPINVKIGEGNFSTIRAIVCDSTNVHVPEYDGYITFTKTPLDFGTFYGNNPVYTTNGIATIELSSDQEGTATITAEADGGISSNNICEVEFYEETTLTLVVDSVACVPTCDIITFNVKVTGENIEVDEMKISWSNPSSAQRLNKITINDEEVYSGNVKSDTFVDITNTLASGENTIKLTFGQNMTGKHITVIFYPPVSGQYPIEFDVP